MRDASFYGKYNPNGIPAARGAEWAPSRPDLWTAHTPFNPSAGIGGTALPAFASEGRWIVQCACGGAQLACVTDLRFMCVNCGNADNGGKWRPIVFPTAKAQIDALLDARPMFPTQNWLPGEKVSQLIAENAAIGVSTAVPA